MASADATPSARPEAGQLRRAHALLQQLQPNSGPARDTDGRTCRLPGMMATQHEQHLRREPSPLGRAGGADGGRCRPAPSGARDSATPIAYFGRGGKSEIGRPRPSPADGAFSSLRPRTARDRGTTCIESACTSTRGRGFVPTRRTPPPRGRPRCLFAPGPERRAIPLAPGAVSL